MTQWWVCIKSKDSFLINDWKPQATHREECFHFASVWKWESRGCFMKKINHHQWRYQTNILDSFQCVSRSRAEPHPVTLLIPALRSIAFRSTPPNLHLRHKCMEGGVRWAITLINHGDQRRRRLPGRTGDLVSAHLQSKPGITVWNVTM